MVRPSLLGAITVQEVVGIDYLAPGFLRRVLEVYRIVPRARAVRRVAWTGESHPHRAANQSAWGSQSILERILQGRAAQPRPPGKQELARNHAF